MAPIQAEPAQSFQSSYAPRLRQYSNSLAAPILVTQAIPTGRTTKRGTTVINYADDVYDEDDFEDSEGVGRRLTGLRSRPQELDKKDQQHDKLGKEIREPTEVQAIFRPWMADTMRSRKAPYVPVNIFNPPRWWPDLMCLSDRTLQGAHAQAQFPLTLIPIRIEYEIPPHQQDTPFPLPPQQRAIEMGNTLASPAFRRPEQSPGYKIRDIFMWNLHEALSTPEDFAVAFVQDLDLPNPSAAVAEISKQIRSQLEDYAGVALHPLFHAQPIAQEVAARATGNVLAQKVLQNGPSRIGTPRPASGRGTPMRENDTPRVSTPAADTPQPVQMSNGAQVTAEATPLPEIIDLDTQDQQDVFLNLDDTYRCIITLSIYHSSRLYQDKFEWSLLHPPGAAEAFAKQTCADMGLNGEWVLAITHAIYEAVLKLKKETCEGGNMMTVGGIWGQGEIDNQAVRAEVGAGWRYDDRDFGAEWEPKLEALSKEEIEKREGDRERQLRRLRRETARFTSTAGITPSAREQEAQSRGSYFDMPGFGGGEDTPMMGRGERNRKKRKLRSPSPSAKTSTPAEPTDAGWGGEANKLQEHERYQWRCSHCLVWGTAVWAVRNGPKGPRTLCNNCGLLYERDKQLPAWSKDLHKNRPKIPMGGR
ncbi:Chromatin structure remodeling complex protein sfh1 [Neophaeococcomyces mojaviensis]|uniref:Chromatin structure remodeling complex protein sfh1 n=1 Tax=Neophaeococcomyces mojaviensis TaxID=3383035 RepID=A0ACC3AHD2_9EURO|nr:Chromatin structure remodeling complex protein sfh1 [Knufia sp. JES_112]